MDRDVEEKDDRAGYLSAVSSQHDGFFPSAIENERLSSATTDSLQSWSDMDLDLSFLGEFSQIDDCYPPAGQFKTISGTQVSSSQFAGLSTSSAFGMKDREDEKLVKMELIHERCPSRAHETNPPPRGLWEFVPGTNLLDAKLGSQDPSKFFLFRQQVSNPTEKECRIYSKWEDFDWNDPSDIAALNAARREIVVRTYQHSSGRKFRWTQREKYELKVLVTQALGTGLTKETIDWSQIASIMGKKFEGVIQKKGAPLAPRSKMGHSREVSKRNATVKLLEDREGFSRTWQAIRAQALKYADIAVLLEDSVSNVNKTREADCPSFRQYNEVDGNDGNGKRISENSVEEEDVLSFLYNRVGGLHRW